MPDNEIKNDAIAEKVDSFVRQKKTGARAKVLFETDKAWLIDDSITGSETLILKSASNYELDTTKASYTSDTCTWIVDPKDERIYTNLKVRDLQRFIGKQTRVTIQEL